MFSSEEQGQVMTELTMHVGNVAKQRDILRDNNVKSALDEKEHYDWLLHSSVIVIFCQFNLL